jgi:peptidoglycan/LPS O-acetylase OafA/YrhL
MTDAPRRHAAADHNRALDGLRFFAFLLVFFFHALQYSRIGNWPIIKYGYLGVPIFFVLSGFLIGRILLDLRDKQDYGLGTKLKTFYIRRSLRIFPVYYLFLAILGLFMLVSGKVDPRAASTYPWHLAYLTNFRSFFVGMNNVYEGHFWSLAVEEHFYLLAPLAVLVMRHRRLMALLALTILGVATARWCIYRAGSPHDWAVLSPMQFDLLGLGFATAIIEKKGSFLGITASRLQALGLIGAAVFVVYVSWYYYPVKGWGIWLVTLGPISLGFATAATVLSLWQNPGSLPARFLSLRPLAYFGQISYGLYLFHPNCLGWTSSYFGVYNYKNTIAGLLLTLAAAMVSWHVFERPINDLKNRFTYSHKRLPKTAPVPRRVEATEG